MVREPVVTEPVTVQPQKHDSQGPGKLDNLLQGPQIILLLHTCRFKGGKITEERGRLFLRAVWDRRWPAGRVLNTPLLQKIPNGRTTIREEKGLLLT